MKTATVKAISNVSWAFGKALNLVGLIGARVITDITNRSKHDIQIVNSHTGEIMHEAKNVSNNELTKILDAMRVLKGTVEIIVKTVK